MKRFLTISLLTIFNIVCYSQSIFNPTGASGNWDVDANWSPSGVPISSTSIIIPSGKTCIIPSGYSATCSSMSISGGTLTLQNTSTLNATGTVSLSLGTINDATTGLVTFLNFNMSGGTLNIGSTGLASAVSFPSVSGSTSITNGTVGYFSNTDQDIKPLTYYNLTVQTGSSSATKSINPSGTLTISNNLTVNNGTGTVEFNIGNNTVNVTGNVAGTGNITLGSGTLKISGNFTNTGTFTCGTSTTNFSGSSSQIIRGVNYYNLTLSNTTTKTGTSGTIGISGTFSPGSVTSLTKGGVIVEFNGASQNVPAFTFSNLKVSGSGDKTLTGNVVVDTTLVLNGKDIRTTGSFNLRIGSRGTVSGATNNGHIVGILRRTFATGVTSLPFDIGDGTNLLSTTVSYTGTAGSSTSYIQLTTTKCSEPVTSCYVSTPSISTAGFASLTKLVDRYWRISNSGVTITSLNATFSFLTSDLGSGSPSTGALVAKTFNSATSTWSTLNTSNQTSNSCKVISSTSIPVSGFNIDIWLGEKTATTCTSQVANGNWTSSATWSGCGGTSPTSSDNVIVATSFPVVMDASTSYAKTLTLNSSAKWTSAVNTTSVGTGGIIINSSGDVTGTSFAGVLTTTGNITINRASISSNVVALQFSGGTGQQLKSTAGLASYTIPAINISSDVTNSLSFLNITKSFGGNSSKILTQPASSTLRIFSANSVPTIDASASAATVIYSKDSTTQNISAGTFYSLRLNSVNISKSVILAAGTKVTNDLTISAGNSSTLSAIVNSSSTNINGTGSLTLTGNSTLRLGTNGDATNITFPTTFGTYTLSSSSTVEYAAESSSQAIANNITYNNLVISGSSSLIAKTLSSSPLNVNNNLTLTNVTLNLGSNTINIGGSFTGTGILDPTTGSSTVNYNSSSSTQAVFAGSYFNLTLSNSGLKTLPSSTINIKGSLAISNIGTITVTGNTLNFNGTTTQNIDFPFPFNNVSFSNSSLIGAVLSQAISGSNVLGNVSVTSGTLDNGGFDIVGNGSNTFTVSNGATFKTSRVSSPMPSNFLTKNLMSGSTVDYSSTLGQTIDNSYNYSNLTLSGSSTKTVSGTGILYIGGNLTSNGYLDATTNNSTVEFNGTSGNQLITGINTFYNLNKSGASNIGVLTNMQTINHLFNISSGSGKINSVGKITLINGASLIDNNTSTSFPTGGAGNVIIQKTAPANTRSYYLSGPITSYIASTLTAGQSFQVLSYDTDGTPSDVTTVYNNTCSPALKQKGSFNGLYKSTSGTLQVGKGYSVQQTTTKSLSFTGNVNFGNISFPTLCTINRTIPDISGFNWCANNTGFVLMGNPYPSEIDWNLVYSSATGINSSAKIWNGVNYTDVSSTDPLLANRAIKTGQGFLIQVLSTNIPGGSLTFQNSQRIINNNGSLLRTEDEISSKIQVEIFDKKDEELKDILTINFNEDASDDYDLKYDSYDLPGITEVPSITAIVNGNELSTTEFPKPLAQKSLPLSLSFNNKSTYEVKISDPQSIPSDMTIYFVDKVSKKEFDLSMPNSLSIEKGKYYNYEIQLRKETNPNSEVETTMLSNKVYSNNNKIVLEYNENSLGEITVLDLSGKNILTKNALSKGKYEFNLNNKNVAQFYIVKISSTNATETYKVILE